MATKANSKLCQASEIELFSNSKKLKALLLLKKKPFTICEKKAFTISEKKAVHYF